MGAIDEVDGSMIESFTASRNTFAHELKDIIATGRGPDFEKLFPELVELVTKVERWWIYNVDIATDPSMADLEVDKDEITPGSLLILQIIDSVALGDDDRAWELYKSFKAATNAE